MPFVCKYPECSRVLSSKYNLNRHVETFHLKLKKFRCQICFKSLSSSQNLKEHMHLHRNTDFSPELPRSSHVVRDLEIPKLTELVDKSMDADLRPFMKINRVYLCTPDLMATKKLCIS